MRIDKYLWCVRYFKTRAMATHACKNGHVRINALIAKPARTVYVSDQITLRKNQINYELIVQELPKSRVGAKLVDLYRKDVTPQSSLERLALLKNTKDYYRKKGTGRPTKKDRRAIDDWLSNDSAPTETPNNEEE